MTWAFGQTVGRSGAKFVLTALADKADETHSCFPGVVLLAKETELSERSVRAHLNFLEAEGYITRARRYKGFGARTSDRYVLSVELTIAQRLELTNTRAFAASDEQPAGEAPRAAQDTESASAENSAAHAKSGPMKNSDNIHAEDSSADAATAVADSSSAVSSAEHLAPLAEDIGRALKEPPELTPRSSSSTRAAGGAGEPEAAPRDDEEASGLGWFDQGVATLLAELDPRLDLRLLVGKLRRDRPGLRVESLDLELATSEVLSSAARRVHDPVAYVAKSILSEPHRWVRTLAFDARTSTPGLASDVPERAQHTARRPPTIQECAASGHRWVGQFRESCVACGEERPGWRHDRDSFLNHQHDGEGRRVA